MPSGPGAGGGAGAAEELEARRARGAEGSGRGGLGAALRAGRACGVVAEGVGTRGSREQLPDPGCDEAQGFWLGRPTPADEVPELVASIRALVAGGVRPRGEGGPAAR